jgi:hypothetical protein
MPPKNDDKALTLERKGDQFRADGEITKAFECYGKALEFAEDRVGLYDKLIALHELVHDEWTEQDFATNLTWTMKRAELLNPDLKRAHHRATPEHRQIKELISKLMRAPEAEEAAVVEKIVTFGADAVYPLTDVLLQFKHLGKKK